jgi:hypothetical protein
MRRPYVLALIIAVGLIAAGGVFALAMSAYVASLGVPPGGGIELPSTAIWCVSLADLLVAFWWFFIPLAFIICLGAAWLFGAGPAATHQSDPPR